MLSHGGKFESKNSMPTSDGLHFQVYSNTGQRDTTAVYYNNNNNNHLVTKKYMQVQEAPWISITNRQRSNWEACR